ncbi:MAG: hypothetical protein ACJASL_000410 [Paraglaciecola sp.]|jgi:hypothetical protein
MSIFCMWSSVSISSEHANNNSRGSGARSFKASGGSAKYPVIAKKSLLGKVVCLRIFISFLICIAS